MNILEHYIKEVHSIREVPAHPKMIIVDVTCDCWGSISRTSHITDKEEWAKSVERGYFLG